MKGSIAISFFVTVIFAAGYFYYVALAICPVPLEYRVGVIDDGFAITRDEAKLAAASAESIWEDATGRNLFTYDESADFAINFIFDERQALAEAENQYKERLDTAQEVNDTIAARYEALVQEYEELKLTYADRFEAYERALSRYNAKVAEYNREGGAPPEVYEQLQSEKAALDGEQRELNSLTEQLNSMVDEINSIGQQGNQLIETYNRGVESYNQKFGEPREFTQGDYQGDTINIYTFETEAELELVLAHEFGHALHLDHVEGEQSVMHFLIGEQPEPLRLTQNDLNEFVAVCGGGIEPLVNRLRIRLGL